MNYPFKAYISRCCESNRTLFFSVEGCVSQTEPGHIALSFDKALQDCST